MRAIAVVGLGAMGSRIAQRLLSAGHEIIVWNRSPAKLAQLIDLGATAAESPADAARRADVLITMVTDPAALRAVSEGGEGIAAGADFMLTVIEMSTVGPAGVARLASALPAGTPLLDAPVLGSLGEAEAGSLTIFVGGPVALVEQAEPLLSILGSVLHVGPLGAGQAASWSPTRRSSAQSRRWVRRSRSPTGSGFPRAPFTSSWRRRRSLVRPSADETRSNGATTHRASRSRSPARMPS